MQYWALERKIEPIFFKDMISKAIDINLYYMNLWSKHLVMSYGKLSYVIVMTLFLRQENLIYSFGKYHFKYFGKYR